MGKGIIFSIEEFAIYDGPGIRTSTFFKGCPLRCEWCHNPEGLSGRAQIAKSPNGCIHCNACKAVCPSPGNCLLCGRCVKACPNNLLRICGTWWEARELARMLYKYKAFFESSGGGLTFSGGEVLYQPEFLLELLQETKGIHRAIETSGFAPARVFQEVIENCDLVMLDLKVMDDTLHKRYTGVSNKQILENFNYLKDSQIPFVVRIPLIPGVNDTQTNFLQVAQAIGSAAGRIQVEILPYNRMAGAKYAMMGMEYRPTFSWESQPDSPFLPLTKAGISWRVL